MKPYFRTGQGCRARRATPASRGPATPTRLLKAGT